MNEANAAILLSVFAYTVSFLMAYTSKSIELANTYGAYYQFIRYSPRTFLYCGTYGLIGIIGYWLYKSNAKPDLVDMSTVQLNNSFLLVIFSAMIIGWSAKGFSDTPLLPARSSEGQANSQDGFKLSVIIGFLFKDNNDQYDLIITQKQRAFFNNAMQSYMVNGKDKNSFDQAVYTFLAVHPRYGGGDKAAVAKFNAIMDEQVKQQNLEQSMRYVYRNLGYRTFKAVIK